MNNRFITRLSLFSLALVVSLGSTSVVAQDEMSADEPIEEVVVTGIRQSLARAIDIKRTKTEFVDGLVAEDFAKFPDSNLAEALQRIPGITVERNDGGSQSNAVGEAASINVRGLGPAFTRTEINGVTATNPGQDRGFGFNVLASELFQSVIVKKSLNAKDNEGGLAGTVNLQTYRPLDTNERTLVFSPKMTYSDLAEEFDPAATLIYVDKTNDERFGIAVGINYSNTQPREDMADVSNWDFLSDSMRGNFDLLTPEQQADLADLKIPRDPRIMVNTRDHKRLNAALTLQMDPTDDLRITFDNLISNVDHTGRQTRNDFPIEGFPATFLPPDLVRNGDQFVSGTFPAASHFMRILDYDYDVQTSLYQGILSAQWDVNDSLRVVPTIGYSTAEQDFKTWNSFDVRSGPTDIFYEVVGDFTRFTPAIGSPSDPTQYTVLSRIRNRPTNDQDDEISAKLDFEWQVDRGAITAVDFGVRFAEREKAFRAFDGRATLDGSITDLSPYIIVDSLSVSGSPSGFPTQILSLDFDALMQAAAPNGFDVPERLIARYNVSEETLAGYGMVSFDFNETVAGNIGVRVVKTDQTSDGFENVTDSGGNTTLRPVTFNNDYTYALPSLNVKWELNDDMLARFSVYRSLTRPELTDIQPGRNFDNFDGGNGTSGNPDLDPFTSTNIDLGFEWYFAGDAAFTAAVFRKDMNGLIERVVEEVQVTDSVTGQTFTVNMSRPVNGESAEINGFEIGVQSPFSFAEGFLRDAGFVLNATFTDSEASFRNENDLRSSRLPGLSKESYNAILYYDTEVFNTRLAYNWRSDYLIAVSGSGGNPLSRDAYGQLDFSSTWNIGDMWSVNFDVINVTDEQIRSFSFLDENKAKGLIQTGRKIIIGASVRF